MHLFLPLTAHKGKIMKTIFIAGAIFLVFTTQSFATGSKPIEPQEAEQVSIEESKNLEEQERAQKICNSDRSICVGDLVIETVNNHEANIAAIDSSQNNFSLTYNGKQHRNWNYRYIAITRPGTCLEEFCVGDLVIETLNNRWAKIAGINFSSGKYVLKNLSDNELGSWESRRLSITKPGTCLRELCVGDLIIEDINNREGKVVGINKDGTYSLASPGGETLWGSWGSMRISVRERAKDAAERTELDRLIKEGIVDPNIYANAKKAGASHPQAIDQASGPTWISPGETKKFVEKLSQFVYAFDKNYLLQISALYSASANTDGKNIFMTAALLPYLKYMGYSGLKERYLDNSVKKIESYLQSKGVKTLHDVESTTQTRKMAVQMLAISLTTAMPQMTESQKSTAQSMLRVLSTLAATEIRYKDFGELMQIAASLEAFLLELSQNNYLQARSTTDMLLLQYLKNS